MPPIEHSSDSPSTDSKSVEIYAARDTIEAHALGNLLRDEGVDVRIVGEVLEAVHGGVPYGTASSPRLWVGDHDVARARQLISEWKARSEVRSSRTSVGSFRFGTMTLIVNLTILAVVFAITRSMGRIDFWNFLVPIVIWLILGNVLCIAYYRKKNQTFKED